MDSKERATRMLEEALELAQAMGVDTYTAALLWNQVYSKPPGVVWQELGGAALTLLACAESSGEVLSQCADRELERIETLLPEKFQKRQDMNAQMGIGAPRES
jgi:hypothetical protein